MFKGAVTFQARIKGNGRRFPSFEFSPNVSGVDTVEIEAPDGEEIRTTVYLVGVVSSDAGREIATKVNMATLNRICFNYDIVFEGVRCKGSSFSPLDPQPGVISIEALEMAFALEEVKVVSDIPPSLLKAELEKASPPGEQNYGLFRSALQSTSPVEEFMHLYHIFLMIRGDDQKLVETFIISEDPAVPQTKDPREWKDQMETVYTRLRNEFAHRRAGVNLETTKSEMAERIGGLRALVKRAIELDP